MKNFLKILFAMISLAFGLAACSSANKAGLCINDKETQLLIKWGDQYNNIGGKIYSAINANLDMYKVREDTLGNKIFSDSVKITPESFCRIKRELTQLILKTQAMYFPGSTQQFIEYVSPQQNIYFRAIWNPEHTNYGNKDLRSFYDSLTYKIEIKH